MINADIINAEQWLNADDSRMILAEDYIFLASIHDYDFWLTTSEKLCLDPITGKSIDDFDVVERNIIFTGLRKLQNITDVADASSSVTEGTEGGSRPNTHASVLKEFLTQEALLGNLCSEDEIDGVIAVYEEALKERDKAITLTPLAKKFLPIWLSRKRREHIANTTRDMTIDEMLTVSEQHSDAVSGISASSTDLFLFGNHPRNEEIEPGIDLLTLPNLSQSLGSLYRGDAYMFQAPTGGGKTVMATQILVDLIGQGRKGLFISTEQPWREIEPRLISNAVDIPISEEFLRNQFDYQKAEELQPSSRLDDIIAWEESIKGMFVFSHWNTDNTQSVRTDLEATIRKSRSLLGCDPEFVILDWIGGALGSDVNSDNLRFVYQATADAFAAASQKHNFIGIAFAQSKMDRTYYALGSEQLAECKTMHRKFTALVGITAISVKDDQQQQANTEPKYQADQFLDVSKSRKGEAARIRVKRDFKYQRFLERK